MSQYFIPSGLSSDTQKKRLIHPNHEWSETTKNIWMKNNSPYFNNITRQRERRYNLFKKANSIALIVICLIVLFLIGVVVTGDHSFNHWIGYGLAAISFICVMVVKEKVIPRKLEQSRILLKSMQVSPEFKAWQKQQNADSLRRGISYQ
jgi:hypothetical protein